MLLKQFGLRAFHLNFTIRRRNHANASVYVTDLPIWQLSDFDHASSTIHDDVVHVVREDDSRSPACSSHARAS